MHTHLRCLSCLLGLARRTLEHAGAAPDVQERATREILLALSRADLSLSPPHQARTICAIIQRETGNPDPYAGIKRACNEMALALAPRLQRRIQTAQDPFRTAVKLALAGNTIDFGMKDSFDLEQAIRQAEEREPVLDGIDLLRQALAPARRVLYLADNAGEIVLDRLLIEEILPGRQVTLAVRGGPAVNDALRQDAEEAGLTGLGPALRIVDSGLDLSGTSLAESSDKLRRAFADAEVIIAKGQGNYETLEALPGSHIFFLFMVKCAIVARHTGHEMGSTIVGRPGAPVRSGTATRSSSP